MLECNPNIEYVKNAVLIKVDVVRLPLINRFYTECAYRAKCGRRDLVFSYESSGQIIAAARLLPQTSGDFILRSVCVAPEYRAQGIATVFVSKILNELQPANCYCFSLVHLQAFYQRLGFVCLTPDYVPEPIAVLAERYRTRGRDWVLMGFVSNIHKLD